MKHGNSSFKTIVPHFGFIGDNGFISAKCVHTILSPILKYATANFIGVVVITELFSINGTYLLKI